MLAIWQTISSNASFLKKSFVFRFKFPWTLIHVAPIDNITSTVFSVAGWHRTSNRPLPEPMMTEITYNNMRHMALVHQRSELITWNIRI